MYIKCYGLNSKHVGLTENTPRLSNLGPKLGEKRAYIMIWAFLSHWGAWSAARIGKAVGWGAEL